jgi:hypothetical protein
MLDRSQSIELAFAKIKHWMRIAEKRTVEDTWRHIGTSSKPSTPPNARTNFAKAVYTAVKT